MTKRDYTKTFAKREETTARHARMKCVTRELKLKANTRSKREWLDRVFTESKWLYNYYLQLHKENKTPWSKMPTRDNGIIVKYPTGYETRTIYAASSSIKQGIRDRLKTNEKSLTSNIKNGNITHGVLHYISKIESVPLPAGCREGEKMQAFRWFDDKKHVSFQASDRIWRVYGGHQIPDNAEIASGKLVKHDKDYYLQVTFYVEWSEDEQFVQDNLFVNLYELNGIGLDFGIDTNVTTSTADKFDWWFDESERLKKAQADNQAYRAHHLRAFGWEASSKKQLAIINAEYEKLRRRKQDAVNKFVHYLGSKTPFVAVQEEQIRSWHSDERYSGMVQHSILGGIMRRLLEQPTTLTVSKWTRTTGVCPDCGHVLDEKLPTSTREWDCPECGAHHDRDVAAARVILLLVAIAGVYPLCPGLLPRDVWVRLLGVLGLDTPAYELAGVGLLQ